jgi:hypothetical protein
MRQLLVGAVTVLIGLCALVIISLSPLAVDWLCSQFGAVGERGALGWLAFTALWLIGTAAFLVVVGGLTGAFLLMGIFGLGKTWHERREDWAAIIGGLAASLTPLAVGLAGLYYTIAGLVRAVEALVRGGNP